jgi:preprotein translocase subunit YajC
LPEPASVDIEGIITFVTNVQSKRIKVKTNINETRIKLIKNRKCLPNSQVPYEICCNKAFIAAKFEQSQ